MGGSCSDHHSLFVTRRFSAYQPLPVFHQHTKNYKQHLRSKTPGQGFGQLAELAGLSSGVASHRGMEPKQKAGAWMSRVEVMPAQLSSLLWESC